MIGLKDSVIRDVVPSKQFVFTSLYNEIPLKKQNKLLTNDTFIHVNLQVNKLSGHISVGVMIGQVGEKIRLD